MKDRRLVDDLTLQQLEEVVRLRRRQARLARLRTLSNESTDTLDPLVAGEPDAPASAASPDPARYRDLGGSTQYRAQQLDEPPEAEPQPRQPLRVRWSWVRDKGLLVLELALVTALAVVLISSLTTLHDINEASSAAQALPEATAAPLIQVTPVAQAVVLPGGHTPPDAPGGAAPEEVPAHLQALVSEITPLPLPTRGPEQAVRVQIEAIGVDAPVIEGDDWEALKQGAGHHVGSANPGERGNCVISAHNDIYGELFRDLPSLKLGDEIVLHTATQAYRYLVTEWSVTEPEDVSVLRPTESPVLTLISCYPYGIDSHRIVVVAELQPN
jgi:sortase A